MRKIDSNYSRFSRRCVGQRHDHSISVYDFAYVRRNRPQDLPDLKARRDFARQIEEQLKPLVLTLKFRFSAQDRKSTRLNSSHDQISYAVFCLKKKKTAALNSSKIIGDSSLSFA